MASSSTSRGNHYSQQQQYPDDESPAIEMKRAKLKRQPSIRQPLVSSTSSKRSYTTENKGRRPPIKRHMSRLSMEDLNYSFSATDLGYRRKLLLRRHRWTIDVQLALALFGIFTMVLNIELLIKAIYDEHSLPSVTLRLMVTVSTVILDIALISAWAVNVQLRMLDNGYSTWRVAVKPRDFLILAAEIIVCTIHPIPRSITLDVSDITPYGRVNYASIDGILSIIMMTRLYIVIKFIAAHSDLRAEGSYQHFSSISSVKINITFVFKALMSTKPGFVLVCFTTVIFIVNSWSLRTCEVYYDSSNEVGGFMNATWLVAMTFLTVGYGDVVPKSYCGRFISAVTGIMGVATTALLVAVLASMLEQTQTERCVHNFVKRIHLERSRKRAAANVIKMSAKLWLFQNSDVESGKPAMMILNKLNQNVSIMRNCKRQLALLGETTSDIADLGVSVNRLSDLLEKSIRRQKALEQNVLDFRHQMDAISNKLDKLLDIR